MSYKAYLNTPSSLAREASKYILQNIDRLDRIKVHEKAKDDYVSSVDQSIDAFIIEKLQTLYPEHTILTEESGLINGTENSDYLWVIDPIDGTNNFINGIPIFGISIALLYKNEPVVGVIYQPMTDELFSASLGEGSKLNNVRIRITDNPNCIPCVLLSKIENLPPAALVKKLPISVKYRIIGTAAISVAYQAAGRCQLFYAKNLKLWDIAAGIIIAKEAGASVQYKSSTNFAFEDFTVGNSNLMTISL